MTNQKVRYASDIVSKPSAKSAECGVGSEFRIFYDYIETPGGGIIIFQGMQDQNAPAMSFLASRR
jgi:phage terminase large subunit